MKIIFFGTPPFAAEMLKELFMRGVNIVAIVTKPDKVQGRSNQPVPTAVKQMARDCAPDIPVFQPEVVSDPAFAPTLAAFEADLFLVVAYGEIIKQHLLDMPPLGCINVHGSILPKYRGAAPIQHAIINGEIESGITIIHMVKKMDAGDMIRIARVPVGENTTFGELTEQLWKAAIDPLCEVLDEYKQGKIPASEPQDLSQVTFAPKIELEDCRIDWNRPAQEIHNLVRGVNPEPGAWCCVQLRGETKRLRIFRTEVDLSVTAAATTLVKCNKEGLVVACGQGGIKILELQLEGKRRMTAKEFSSGVSAEILAF